MKNPFLKSVFMLTVLLFMAVAACAHTSPQVGIRGQQSLPQGDTIEVMSRAMDRVIKNVVIVPERYYDADLQQERYPVIYLLHGAAGDYSDWATRANLDTLSTMYGIIIVCPDGQDSWYFDSPVDPKMQFETYVSKELVEYIDSHYRTHANRYMRAITGLSMGGHGALFLAFRHPDVFWSCGSMSGCMNISKFPDRWHIKDRLGDYESNMQRWDEHAVCNLIGQVKASTLEPAQNIIIDDGTKDIFYAHNMAMHEMLLEAGIDHDFTIRPGRHSWDYWVNSLDYHMLFFHKAFLRGAKLMNE